MCSRTSENSRSSAILKYFCPLEDVWYGKTTMSKTSFNKGGHLLGTGKDFLSNPTILFLKWRLPLMGRSERGRNSELYFERDASYHASSR